MQHDEIAGRALGTAGPSRSHISRAPVTPSSNRSLIVSATSDAASEATLLALRIVSPKPREASSCIREVRSGRNCNHPRIWKRRPAGRTCHVDKRRGSGRNRTCRVLQLVITDEQPQRAAPDQSRVKRVLAGSSVRPSTQLPCVPVIAPFPSQCFCPFRAGAAFHAAPDCGRDDGSCRL